MPNTPNEPNRSRAGSPSANPTPAEIINARSVAGLSQAKAAALVHTTVRTWQQWEAAAEDKKNHRRMHPAFWELFRIKTATLIAHK